MTTALYSHPDCLDHVTPPGHPERVDRLHAVEAALAEMPLDRREAPVADDAEILRCHPQTYLDRVRSAVPEQGFAQLDADTFLSPGSLIAARRAVGAAVDAVDTVLSGRARTAFVACRPPGHHAETETAMGFCLFGTAAIAAKRALDHHGLSQVAVVDFDVHHGNGTQDLLWDEARVLYVSSHQMPLFPGTGARHEIGAHGQILNLPLAPGSGSAEMRRGYEEVVLPALDEAAPELVIVSAGFDAHADDPLASLGWSTQDFAWLSERLVELAKAHAGGRVVSTLEGGYDLDALGASVAAHVEALGA